jgi:outer membrane protein OmpA-like peptidoglycan-associated protein
MKMENRLVPLTATVLLLCAGALPSLAQDGKLKIHVTPKQAYAFVDGHAYGEATIHALYLSPGDHKVDLYNYGYAPASSSVSITAGKTTKLDVTMTPINTPVPGPVGAMTIEGASRDAILLNGKTPDFFVGHGDEFNHEWWWKQELVVPPGTYQVTVLAPVTGSEVWSGPVEVPVNQRVVVDIPKGVRKTVPWPRGEKMTDLARFKAGTATATVAVAKPTAQLSTTAAQVNCGDGTQLKWTAADAPQVAITPVGTVAPSGEQNIQPKQTTVYQLTALGPGGTATASTTVNVNTGIQADLGLTPTEVKYKRVGDQVVDQSGSALNWTAANAGAVSIDPLGSVSPTGSRTVQVTPHKTDPGPVDETVTYTLTATNDCGGTETKTATLHIVGSIEPDIKVSMRSVYFPTDRPRSVKTTAALLPSEQETLKSIADDFKKLLAYKPDSHLVLSGHADKRGASGYNKSLSERRAEVAKNFLAEQGIPEASIDTQAYGDEQNLSADEVKQLLEQNPNLSAEERQKTLQKLHTIVLANNRRVDLTLKPLGQESARLYPFNAEDYAALIDRNGPTQAGVELASEKKKMKD